MKQKRKAIRSLRLPAKVPTGIVGLDEITLGGLPAGRATLVCGGPGCGKTFLAMEFLLRGARDFGEPGLFVSFEEKTEHLIENFRGAGFDLEGLVKRGKLKISHVDFSGGEIAESGDFSLDGLMIRIKQGIKEVGAKRVVLDTLETIFAALSDTGKLRKEVARLLHWLRSLGVTIIVTGERGSEELTRHGFEEYISDCVVLLDHRVTGQISKRRLRVVKYRGSAHAADEFPFLLRPTGVSVLPITSVHLDHDVGTRRISTGIKDLDEMFAGKGYFHGSSVLVTGKAGTGKSTLAASFAAAAGARGEHCLYFSLEESMAQIVRNMKSVGIDLAPLVKRKLLTVQAFRPTLHGLEEHLVAIIQAVTDLQPQCVVMDPITNFFSVGGQEEIRSMFTRILDLLKCRNITLFLTALTAGSGQTDETEAHVSSMVDAWMALDLAVVGHVRRRELYIIKARGMDHSRETHELVMSARGLSLRQLNTKAEP